MRHHSVGSAFKAARMTCTRLGGVHKRARTVRDDIDSGCVELITSEKLRLSALTMESSDIFGTNDMLENQEFSLSTLVDQGQGNNHSGVQRDWCMPSEAAFVPSVNTVPQAEPPPPPSVEAFDQAVPLLNELINMAGHRVGPHGAAVCAKSSAMACMPALRGNLNASRAWERTATTEPPVHPLLSDLNLALWSGKRLSNVPKALSDAIAQQTCAHSTRAMKQEKQKSGYVSEHEDKTGLAKAKDGKWLPWILDLGVKDRNTMIRDFELSQSDVSNLKQASARRKHSIAQRRHQSKKAQSMVGGVGCAPHSAKSNHNVVGSRCLPTSNGANHTPVGNSRLVSSTFAASTIEVNTSQC